MPSNAPHALDTAKSVELDDVFVLEAKSRLLERAAAARDTEQSKRASEKGRSILETNRPLLARPVTRRITVEEAFDDLMRRFPQTMDYLRDSELSDNREWEADAARTTSAGENGD